MLAKRAVLPVVLILLAIGCSAPIELSPSGSNAQRTAAPTGSPPPTVTPSPSGRGELPRGGEPVILDPADFVARIDHEY